MSVAARQYGRSARAMSAPNRYRAGLRTVQKLVLEAHGYIAAQGLFLLLNENRCAEILSEALAKQRAEWPNDAYRALGLEPCLETNLVDVVLVWDGAQPLLVAEAA